uniref:G protein-coupled receptor 160 n=3 Tax=Cyprinus carpio TaxID=7962 RepID=A0A8C1BV78_CYPCA
METSIPSFLLVLWLKSLLNWLVVVVQRHYVIRSFSGFFCISLALIDSLLSFVLTAVFYLEDFNISGWHFTGYNICRLAQITCFIYTMLHWPVFLLVGLDNFWKLSSSSTHTSWKQKLTYCAGVGLLWILAALYVFSEPDGVLLLGDDEKHQCELLSSPQSAQVLVALLLTVTGVILYSYAPLEKLRVHVFPHFGQQSCVVCLRRAMCTFLNTWTSFLVLMIVSQLLQIEMHAHLQLNVIWLCFLNSFSVALALCVHSFTSSSKKNDTITDGFCSWYFCFTYGADEWNYGQQSSDRAQDKTLYNV